MTLSTGPILDTTPIWQQKGGVRHGHPIQHPCGRRSGSIEKAPRSPFAQGRELKYGKGK